MRAAEVEVTEREQLVERLDLVVARRIVTAGVPEAALHLRLSLEHLERYTDEAGEHERVDVGAADIP